MRRILILTLLALGTISAIRVTPVSEFKMRKAPTYAAISPDGRYVYVTNYASDEVVVLDRKNNNSDTHFYAGYEPIGIAVNPAGDKLFVTNQKGLVKVINPSTQEILDDIKVGGFPSNIVISPSGFQAFVTNFGRGKIGRVDFFDTSTHRITGEVEVGIRPLAAAISPFGERLYVVCGGSNDLYVIDTSSKKVLKKIGVGLGPDGVALTPDGNTLYVANSRSNDLSVIDLLDLKEVTRVAVGRQPFSIAVNAQGYIFVVESGDNALGVYNPQHQKIATLKTGKKPDDIQLSRDGQFAFVTAEKDNKLNVFSIESPEQPSAGSQGR